MHENKRVAKKAGVLCSSRQLKAAAWKALVRSRREAEFRRGSWLLLMFSLSAGQIDDFLSALWFSSLSRLILGPYTRLYCYRYRNTNELLQLSRRNPAQDL
jgi:hypothetical protein